MLPQTRTYASEPAIGQTAADDFCLQSGLLIAHRFFIIFNSAASKMRNTFYLIG